MYLGELFLNEIDISIFILYLIICTYRLYSFNIINYFQQMQWGMFDVTFHRHLYNDRQCWRGSSLILKANIKPHDNIHIDAFRVCSNEYIIRWQKSFNNWKSILPFWVRYRGDTKRKTTGFSLHTSKIQNGGVLYI